MDYTVMTTSTTAEWVYEKAESYDNRVLAKGRGGGGGGGGAGAAPPPLHTLMDYHPTTAT